ncbi:diguanylate cyclase [Marinomonas ostreistagni]|uniref:sensor domain-containing diguanylate cyclase n=1 Tax=Marinomonas ostreistagni TaxID=359209 RepID=UPI00194E960C|nr:diguanylate cyclase [Marinomonas ostreistagni]MBM6551867.1 diguanylate cyclase [Marinomonas ostreistagni]
MPLSVIGYTSRSIVELLGEAFLNELVQRYQRMTGVGIVLTSVDGACFTRFDDTFVATCLRQQPVTQEGCEPFLIGLHNLANSARQRSSEDLEEVLNCIREHLILAVRQSVAKQFDIESPLRLKEILDASPTPMGWSNSLTGEIEYINAAFIELFGFQHDEIATLEQWFIKAFPDVEYRESVLRPWHIEALQTRKDGNPTQSRELEVTCKDGAVKHVLLTATWVGHKRLVNYTDMTDYWQMQNRLSAHTQMLEMVATGASLESVLERIVEQVQSESKDALCSVLLVDDEQRLRNCVAPNLPEFYLQAIEGLKIGPNIGSCGSAAFLKQRVIVEDISQHRNWQGYTDIARQAGLAACWSDPIISSDERVLGTFAIYYPYPASPQQNDIDLITFASQLASIAIESRRSREALENRAYYDDLTGLANRGYFFDYADKVLNTLRSEQRFYCMVMLDIDHFKQVNDRYGHKTGDEVLKRVARTMQAHVPADAMVGRIGGEEFAIMLPNADKAHGYQIASAIREAVESLDIYFHAQQNHLKVTISAGVAQCCEGSEPGVNIDRLFGRADAALYEAKARGRNCVITYSGSC